MNKYYRVSRNPIKRFFYKINGIQVEEEHYQMEEVEEIEIGDDYEIVDEVIEISSHSIKKFMTIKELSFITGYSQSHLRNKIKLNKISSKDKIGNAFLYPLKEVLEKVGKKK
jgi:hypothetical protein